MLDVLRHFGTREDGFPEWKELALTENPEEVWKHWSSLPLVTKNDLRERFAPESILEKFDVNGAVNSTGGSTGNPTRFVWDQPSALRNTARSLYVESCLGLSPRLPILCLWGSPRDLGQLSSGSSRRSSLLKRLRGFTMVNGYEFDDHTVQEIQSSLERHKHLAMYGFTSLLERAAREFLERGIPVEPGKVVTAWSAAEPLFDYQSDLFAQAFGAPLHNLYGGREIGAVAYQLAGAESFHIMRPDVFVEVVNDDGQPCAPGEVGRIVVTALYGQGTPFIRYENGDLASYAEHDLDESGLSGLTRIEGRISSVIQLPNGKGLHSIFWGQIFSRHAEIKSYHVHQRVDGSIDISYAGDPLSADTEDYLARLITARLEGVPYTINRAAELPKTSQGKYLRVTSDYKPGG